MTGKSRTLFLLVSILLTTAASSCSTKDTIPDAIPDVSVITGDRTALKPSGIKKRGGKCIQTIRTDSALLSILYSKALSSDAIMIECAFTARKDIDSLSLELSLGSFEPESVKNRFCLPFSLPYLRDEGKNIIPDRFISNAETCSNTFSLITDSLTFSVSILPAPEKMNRVCDPSDAGDYYVAMFSNQGSIRLKGLFGNNIRSGSTVTRRILVSTSRNTPGCMETGIHVGEYMNLVHYPNDMDKKHIHDCSMDFLLHNPYAYGKVDDKGHCNFYGSIHSGTGEPYGNGRAIYAMYGNSFSIAVLNHYLKEFPGDQAARERLDAVEGFLLDSDIRTPQGAYWSMLDLAKGKGYVDQAYRKWLETHATAWITYYILDAFETSGNPRYRKAALESLDWLISIQREDGSFPKYFEDGQPSPESMGDAAWAVLAFLKAWQLDMGEKYREAAIGTLGWMDGNVVGARQYFGSFEDVGGVNDSYCPSVTARAFIQAFRCTGEDSYLVSARKALSVSLSWVTTDYTQLRKRNVPFEIESSLKPSYAQIESVSCYYPCSYTLPMMYLACTELSQLLKDNPDEQKYWLGIADNLPGITDFMMHNGTKCRYGMEWLPGPFLVFSEWGNMQLCWIITKIRELESN